MSTPILSTTNKIFLPDHLIMVDCEMTGVLPKQDELLQIAMVRLQREGFTYKEVGEPLDIYLQTDKQPETNFQKEFLTHIFKKCNESQVNSSEARTLIENWLGDLRGKVTPVGDCVIADLNFLYENDIISHSYYENDEPVEGTFHYEIFDMNAIKCIVRTLWGEKKEPEGLDENIHDALVDCRNQTLELNQMLEEFFRVLNSGVTAVAYSQDMNPYVFSSELPADIAPSVEITDLPEHVTPESLELQYGEYILAAQNFEELQGLINKIMLEQGVTEEYRSSLAGVINQFRLENEYTPL